MANRLNELNHRQLAAKMRADLTALEINLDMLHSYERNGEASYQESLQEIAEQIENLTVKTWKDASATSDPFTGRKPVRPFESGEFL